MQKWYNQVTPNQRKLLWICSVPLVLVYGLGIGAIALLLFLEFGRRKI